MELRLKRQVRVGRRVKGVEEELVKVRATYLSEADRRLLSTLSSGIELTHTLPTIQVLGDVSVSSPILKPALVEPKVIPEARVNLPQSSAAPPLTVGMLSIEVGGLRVVRKRPVRLLVRGAEIIPKPLSTSAAKASLAVLEEASAEIDLKVSGRKVPLTTAESAAVSILEREEAIALSLSLTNVLWRRLPAELGLSGLVGEPIIILTPSSTHYIALELCKEIYRELKSGKPPEPRIVTADIDKLEQQLHNLGSRFSDWISDKIVFLDKGAARSEELEKRAYIFRELFSQGLSFIVLEIAVNEKNRDYETILDDYKSALEEVRKALSRASSPYKPKLVELKPVPSLRRELFVHVVSALWGIEINKLQGLLREGLDAVVAEAERLYKDMIHRLLAVSGKYLLKVERHEGETEEHLALKVLTMKHAEEEGLANLEDIQMECPIDGLRADLLIKGKKKVAVEVETLIGTGPIPLLAIRNSVAKYKGKDVGEVWVVLRNFAVSTWLGELWRLRKLLREELDKGVEFYVPDMRRLRLTSFEEVQEKLKEIWRELRPAHDKG